MPSEENHHMRLMMTQEKHPKIKESFAIHDTPLLTIFFK
jgi:hypothetical protein